MRHLFTTLLFSFAVLAQGQNSLTSAEMTALTKWQDGSVVSIHDPSVVFHNGTYTVWGTHRGLATSKDLITWSPQGVNNNTFVRLAKQGDKTGTNCGFEDAFNKQQAVSVVDCDGKTVDFPNCDAENYCNWYAPNKDAHLLGNMWAPDIIYNEQMKKWCLYFSLNGDSWASVIVLLTGDKPTGPFTYQGPVVMSGFTGGSHNISGTNNAIAAPDYTLSDLQLACGKLSSLPARYNQKGSWGSYWPNCIDPCVFYDEEGQLWMCYGSWSGGIWLLRLNNETGLRDYTYHPTSNYEQLKASVTADPYFGTRLAGGHYVSGEGSYIQHIGQYYYLFVTYGGLEANKGYDMRIFRSKTVEGPYKDAAGNLATYTGYQMNYGPTAGTDRGSRIVGAYNLFGGVQEVGERAQGHNSACADDKGRTFVVYHTRFKDGTEGHQVRVHQLFVNEKGWLVAAPFAYRGETATDESLSTACPWTKEELAGTYHVLIHPYRLDHENAAEQTPQTITLAENGKVTGDYTGTWSMKDGSAYLTLKLGTTTYYGVFCPQHINGATRANYKYTDMEAIAFTAMASNGVPVWGYKLAPASAVAWNYTQHTIPVKNNQNVSGNLSLMFETTDNTMLTWTSSEPEVISPTGKYNPQEEAVPVVLTARLECGDAFWEQTFNVKAGKATMPSGDWQSGMMAYYDFDESPIVNRYKAEGQEDYDRMTTSRLGSGTRPALESDWEHDHLHLFAATSGNNSYARTNNPLQGQELEGFSVSTWIKRTDDNLQDAIWSFYNVNNATSSSPYFFLTGNAHVGFSDNGDAWADINKPGTSGTGFIPVGEWTFVTVTVDKESGIRVYVNGASKTAASIASSSGKTLRALPNAEILQTVSQMKYFCLGLSAASGTPDVHVDDLLIHNRSLSATDARALYQLANRVFSFAPSGDDTGIESIVNSNWSNSKYFDLQGRSLPAAPQRGLYIRDGKLRIATEK